MLPKISGSIVVWLVQQANGTGIKMLSSPIEGSICFLYEFTQTTEQRKRETSISQLRLVFPCSLPSSYPPGDAGIRIHIQTAWHTDTGSAQTSGTRQNRTGRHPKHGNSWYTAKAWILNLSYPVSYRNPYRKTNSEDKRLNTTDTTDTKYTKEKD